MEQENSAIKFVGAVFVGAAVGTILGNLLLPKSCKKIQKLQAKNEELKSVVNKKYSVLLKQLQKDLHLNSK
jgi:gas vesicle protein